MNWVLRRRNWIVLGALLLLASTAAAHGGTYRGPSGGGKGPGAGFDPTAGDRSVGATRWESWWANNKDYYLRFAREFHARGATATPSIRADQEDDEGDSEPDFETEVEQRFHLRVLRAALADESDEVRASAAIALGKVGRPEARLELIEALRDDSSATVRDACLVGLGLLGDPADVDPLVERLFDEEGSVQTRSFAAFSLGLLGGAEAAAELERFLLEGVPRQRRERRKELELLASTAVALGLCGGDSARDLLRLVLVSDAYPDDLRPYVMLSIGRLGDAGARTVLVRELISSERADFRRAAAVALGKLGAGDDPLVVDALLGAVHHDDDPVTRHFAGLALGEIDSLELRDALRELLRNGDVRCRPFAALALGRLQDKGSAPLLRKALSGARESSERGALSLALALVGDRESVEVIRSQVRPFVDPWLQGYSALALGILDDLACRDRLWERLEDTKDIDLQTNLSLALGMLGDRRLPEFLVEQATGRMSAFTPNAAMVVGMLRIRRAQPALVKCFYDELADDQQRAFCIVALGMLWDSSEHPRLSRYAVGHDHSLRLSPLDEILSIL